MLCTINLASSDKGITRGNRQNSDKLRNAPVLQRLFVLCNRLLKKETDFEASALSGRNIGRVKFTEDGIDVENIVKDVHIRQLAVFSNQAQQVHIILHARHCRHVQYL